MQRRELPCLANAALRLLFTPESDARARESQPRRGSHEPMRELNFERRGHSLQQASGLRRILPFS